MADEASGTDSVQGGLLDMLIAGVLNNANTLVAKVLEYDESLDQEHLTGQSERRVLVNQLLQNAIADANTQRQLLAQHMQNAITIANQAAQRGLAHADLAQDGQWRVGGAVEE